MANLPIHLSETLTLELIQSLAKDCFRVDAFECVGGKRCKCFNCKPLTLTEACIRHLAGQNQDFGFIMDNNS